MTLLPCSQKSIVQGPLRVRSIGWAAGVRRPLWPNYGRAEVASMFAYGEKRTSNNAGAQCAQLDGRHSAIATEIRETYLKPKTLPAYPDILRGKSCAIASHSSGWSEGAKYTIPIGVRQPCSR